MARVLPSQTTRKRIEDMVNGLSCEFDKSELIREAARLIVEEALEGEVADALGLRRSSTSDLLLLRDLNSPIWNQPSCIRLD